MTSTTLLVIGVFAVAVVAVLVSCRGKSQERSDNEIFEEVLNDPRVNSREVGEREGIEFFQVMKNGKTGFRDLDGNVVIEPKYESAEMFSEGLSAVQLTEKGKFGFINTKGEMVIPPTFEYAGSFGNGLASFRAHDLYGFIDRTGKEVIVPQYAWVDQFSEGFCVVRDSTGRHAFIDTSGTPLTEFKFQYARAFDGGKGKVQLDNKWGAIDKKGNVIVAFTHQYADFD
jgi:WG repeat protein